MEQNSEHPIAKGIRAKAKELSIDVPSVNNFNAITGKGIEVDIKEKKIKVVRPFYFKEHNIVWAKGYTSTTAESIVFKMVNDKLTGYISLEDKIRPESYYWLLMKIKKGVLKN